MIRNWPQNVENNLLKYKLRCNTSDPDCSPAEWLESNDWSRDLPPWAIACNVYCITFCKHLRGALSTRTTASISLYFISTLLVYSYVNFLSQITVLTFSSMTSSSRDHGDSVRIMCYVFYVSFNHFKHRSPKNSINQSKRFSRNRNMQGLFFESDFNYFRF